jgi:hypothetical protein
VLFAGLVGIIVVHWRREERLTARPIVLKLIESGNSSAETRIAVPRRIRPHHDIAIDLQTPAGPTRIIQNEYP